MSAESHSSPLGDLLAFAGTSASIAPVPLALVVLGAALAAYLFGRFLTFAYNYIRISRGLSGIPSAPGAIPLLGHVIPMLTCVRQNKGAWDVMEDWMNKLGPIVKYNIAGTQGVVVRDPAALKRIWQTGYKIYQKDLELSYRPFLPILGTGLVTADGHLWQKQRMLMGPALRVDVLDDIIDIAKRAVDRLCEKLGKHAGTGEVVDIEEEFRLLTLQVIGEAVLSLGPEDCDRVFPSLYLPVMSEANRRVLRPYRMLLPTPEWFRFRSRMQQLNTFLVDLFRKRWQARQAARGDGEKAPKPTDILDRILESIEESGAKWDAALEEQLCYEIKTFLLAGHETSSAMLTWSTGELAANPRMTAQIVKEAETAFGADCNAPPNRRAVDEMTYTLAVLKEALRKYSVVPVVTRKLAEDDPIGLMGHPLPKGIMVACHLQGTHRMYEEPDEFRPERFMPGGEYDQFDDAVRAYMFVPFIQGPRNCLGQHLALLEARVLLSVLQKRFVFSPTGAVGQRHPSVIPVSPVGGLKVTISRRQ
ncbi:hypothetical protein HYH03_013893 [Edaphochlamys debaryana]|uniref:Cytochrome P450 n=1 Tax=Edaphochlamys debaryana TaxID=47281 RepID=A0A835XP46_9CHLO|nr:hypothetical protein HYH03_013893 [Edaphochlamys debaryana]|eukprot:KAG2487471.1 hypothetical protein HYH03_013893 [Edaphochlamys debaryana]